MCVGGATVTCLGPPLPGHCDAKEQLLSEQACPQPPPAQSVTTADTAVSGAVGVSRPVERRAEIAAEMVSLQGRGWGGAGTQPRATSMWGLSDPSLWISRVQSLGELIQGGETNVALCT